MSGQLLDRIVRVAAGPPGGEGKLYEGLRISFDCTHDGGRHPSQGRVRIYNVAPDSIALFKPRRNVIALQVGYVGAVKQLFAGNPIRNGLRIWRSGGDRILEAEVSDGGAGYSDSFIAKTFSGDTPAGQVLDTVLSATGWTRGDIDSALGQITLPGSTTFTDRAPEILDRMASWLPGGGTWFVRDGALYVKRAGEATPDRALRISQQDGNLIGTPTSTNRGVRLTALIDATMRPGQRVRVEHRLVTGDYRVTDVRFYGDSGYANEYYMDITGVRLGVT